MKEQIDVKNIWNASANQLLRLTPDIVHRPIESNQPILRTFIKVSCSNSIYNLKGNATNPEIKGLTWEKVERKLERNPPIGERVVNKYEVGAGDEFIGVYYAETEEEAILEARSDHYYNSEGKKISLRDCGIPTSDLLRKMTARKVG